MGFYYGVNLLKFNFDECIKKRLLRKTIKSRDKAKKSIIKAENFLSEAKKNHKNDRYNTSLISSYLVMFHSAKSLLLKDGFREKSHACVARYLEEKYVKKGLLELKWVAILDRYRELRHSDQYGLDFYATKEVSSEAIQMAEKFLKRLKQLLRDELNKT